MLRKQLTDVNEIWTNANATEGHPNATLPSFNANSNTNMMYTRNKVTATKAPPTFRKLKWCMEIHPTYLLHVAEPFLSS
jgi:hypothetical protein